MTRDEMIHALEGLKDSFNDHRRETLTKVQAGIAAMPTEKIVEVEKPVEVIVEVEKPVEREVVVPVVGDRREEPRDPFESDQHRAETLKLPVL